MKKLDNIDQLDALFKSKLEGAQVPAPPEVWSQVASSAGNSAGALQQVSAYFSSVTNIIKLALFVGGIASVGVILYTANNGNEVEPTHTETIQESDGVELNSDSDIEEATQEIQSADNVIQLQRGDQASELNVGLSEQALDNGAIENDNLANPLTESGNQDPTGVINAADNTTGPTKIVCASKFACLGDTKTFSTNDRTKGSWYVNGKLVKENADVMSHRFTSGGKYDIGFKSEQIKAAFELNVNATNAKIELIETAEGTHKLSLTNIEDETLLWWYVNGKKMSQESVYTTRLTVGKVQITAAVNKGNCTLNIDKTFVVKGKGSFDSPNIFTPNNDGNNDIYFVDITHYEKFSMLIIDESSNRVFESTNPKVGWNGKVNNTGMECNSGIYYVKVIYKLEGEKEESTLIKLTLNR